MSFYTPGTYSTNEVMSAAKVNRDFFSNMTRLYAQFPQRATLWHNQSIVTNGTAITGTIDTAQLFMTYFYQGTPAIDDQWTHKVRLGPGVYQVKFTGQQYGSGGIFDIDIDGTSVGDGWDTYSGATQRNVDLLGGNGYIEIVRSAVYTVTVTVYDKNGSSSDYGLRLTCIDFIPVAGDL